MKISVYNFKGGVGKTSISLGYALNQEYAIVTNDFYSPIERVLKEENLIKLKMDEKMPKFASDLNIIFDLGGQIDSRAISAIEQSDWVIIPTVNSYSELQVTLETINQVKDYNSKILIIANKVGKGDEEKIKTVIGKFFKQIPILPLKRSRIFMKILEEKKSFKEIAYSNGLNKYIYRDVVKQFENIISYINSN